LNVDVVSREGPTLWRRFRRFRRSLTELGVAAAVLLGALPGGVGASPLAFDVVDLHVDLPYQYVYRGRPFSAGTGQYPAEKLAGAGVVGVVLPLYAPRQVGPDGPRRQDLEASYARVFEALATTPPFGLPGCGSAEVRTWLAFEGAAPLANHLEDVPGWVARGVRSFGLVHSYDNALAGSATGAARGGLTTAGRAVTRRVYAAGGFLDVSHASDRALADVLAIAGELGKPVVATHSNVRALAGHPRNLSAAQLRGIARTGGVIGINFHAPYLARGRAATLADVVEHVRYAVRIAGVSHVAIGSDFEGDIRPPPELSDVAAFPRLARALSDAGLATEAVRAIMSENALRILCPRLTKAAASASRGVPPKPAIW